MPKPISSTAKPWPTNAAERVAFERSPVSFHAAARRIRPPSSGNAGTRLNTSSTAFIVTRNEMSSSGISDGAAPSSRAASQKSPVPAIAMPTSEPTVTIASVTSGPATATKNSLPGVSVSWLIFMTPPKKKRSIPATPIPTRRAASAWPSSCSRIEPKNSTAAPSEVA